ncbi:MAG: Type 1 glutamine amidotransferase-like domain-containing protein [Acetanaerobacterium sp.]
MIDSRCGLHCTGCTWKDSHGCDGCIETQGHPFHGECPIAVCCQDRGHNHCGECDIIPCDRLYAHSCLDPEHGDKPQGARVALCRKWAAESGKKVWSNVLLTSAGWINNIDGGVKENIRRRFLNMLGKKASEARVLFIPTAATYSEAKKMVGKCRDELLNAGIIPENITVYDIDNSLSADEAMIYDVIYFTGGDTEHLLRRIKDTGFDAVIKKMVYANKVYVGASAGSIIATPNIRDSLDETTSGLTLVLAYISVHQPAGTPARTDLPLPHIPLTDNQALAVSWDGYELVED